MMSRSRAVAARGGDRWRMQERLLRARRCVRLVSAPTGSGESYAFMRAVLEEGGAGEEWGEGVVGARGRSGSHNGLVRGGAVGGRGRVGEARAAHRSLAVGVGGGGDGGHTDFGVLTVLCQAEAGGLEIQRHDGGWIAMPPIPGTFVVNIGDLLHRWSNRRYRSTVHRVINSSGRERLSLVLAYDPNFETLVDARAFCAADESPHDAPITCGDYLLWRFGKAFSYRQ